MLQVREESEPEKPAESNEDCPKAPGYQFKVNGREEGPNTNSSLEENILFEANSFSHFFLSSLSMLKLLTKSVGLRSLCFKAARPVVQKKLNIAT